MKESDKRFSFSYYYFWILDSRDIVLIWNFCPFSEEYINTDSCIRVLKYDIRLYGETCSLWATCLPNSVLILYLLIYSQHLCNSHPLIFSCINNIGPAYSSGSFIVVPNMRYPEMRQQRPFKFYHLDTPNNVCTLNKNLSLWVQKPRAEGLTSPLTPVNKAYESSELHRDIQRM